MSPISRFLSRNPPIEAIKNAEKEEPSVLSIDDEEADEIFSTLSSVTAREVLSTLYGQPKTASEIADTVDTYLQNVNYHLNNLNDCGLIEVADT
jgi:DNA-binding transcriptional ArsR family regulator